MLICSQRAQMSYLCVLFWISVKAKGKTHINSLYYRLLLGGSFLTYFVTCICKILLLLEFRICFSFLCLLLFYIKQQDFKTSNHFVLFKKFIEASVFRFCCFYVFISVSLNRLRHCHSVCQSPWQLPIQQQQTHVWQEDKAWRKRQFTFLVITPSAYCVARDVCVRRAEIWW